MGEEYGNRAVWIVGITIDRSPLRIGSASSSQLYPLSYNSQITCMAAWLHGMAPSWQFMHIYSQLVRETLLQWDQKDQI